MYESDEYDNSKFTHSLVGNHTFRDSRDFNDFKIANDLPYDCFWDGTGDFVAVSPVIMIHTGDKHTGIPSEFVKLPVPMYLNYSATCKAVAVKLTGNDDAAVAYFGLAGWLEDKGTLS